MSRDRDLVSTSAKIKSEVPFSHVREREREREVL